MLYILFSLIIVLLFVNMINKPKCNCEGCNCKPKAEKKDKQCDENCGCNKDF
jgi:hypothetical protein